MAIMLVLSIVVTLTMLTYVYAEPGTSIRASPEQHGNPTYRLKFYQHYKCGIMCYLFGYPTDLKQPEPATKLCQPSTSLVFVKTHKTGSTTLTKIINRYGLARNLSFMIYAKEPRHGHFRQTSPSEASDILPPVGVEVGDFDHYMNYDMMTVHMRLFPNIEFLTCFMNPWAKYITIMRDPVEQWDSAFFFFNCHDNMKLKGHDNQQKIMNFFEKASAHWKQAHGQCKSYAKNGMAFDLLFNDTLQNKKEELVKYEEEYMKNAIEILDKKLDLVLITEYFDESLILLKHLMCWNFKDILYVSANRRASTYVINETQRMEIRKWNSVDVMLYDHFNRTLWRKIAAFGSRFWEDLDHFLKLKKEYHAICGYETSVLGEGDKVHMKAKNSSEDCTIMLKAEIVDIIKRQNNGLLSSPPLA